MADHILSFFTSLRLTVFCLACALVLVFAGTLAQIHLGLYVTQARYFHSLFVFWTPEGTHWKIPVWPGGYLLGGLLLVNLIAAHIKRFELTWKKSGLFMIHAGLILLFLGQFLTEVFQLETFMRIEQGETKNYTESARNNELAVIDVSDPAKNQVYVFPESVLEQKAEVRSADLPFTIKVKEYSPNSFLAPAMAAVAGNTPRIQATQGTGQGLAFQPKPRTYASDDENVSIALLEVATPAGSLGTWTVSTWFNKDFLTLNFYLHRFLGDAKGQQLAAAARAPQEFKVGNKTYQIALRPVRYYLPYSITLEEFNHKVYKGTDIPKDFSSRIQLRNPSTGDNREVLIYMNNPLRYAGQTFYQGGFEQGDRVSILQVVRNPAWLTPYLSCSLVGLGLVVHFMMHLFKFAKRGVPKTPVPVAAKNGRAPGGKRAPAVAAVGTGPGIGASFETVKRRST